MQNIVDVLLNNFTAHCGLDETPWKQYCKQYSEFHKETEKIKDFDLKSEIEWTANDIVVAAQEDGFQLGFKTALELVFQLVSIGIKC